MKKIVLILTAAATLAFATTPMPATGHGPKAAKKMQKMQKPFLILGKMPHLTKLVMMHWDDLGLSDEQKEKLTQIRKETMGAVKSLKPKIMKLENEVAKATMEGADPDSLKAKVDEIAKLKAEATMAHIKCIYNTKKVLTPEQLAKLTK